MFFSSKEKGHVRSRPPLAEKRITDQRGHVQRGTGDYVNRGKVLLLGSGKTGKAKGVTEGGQELSQSKGKRKGKKVLPPG